MKNKDSNEIKQSKINMLYHKKKMEYYQEVIKVLENPKENKNDK